MAGEHLLIVEDIAGDRYIMQQKLGGDFKLTMAETLAEAKDWFGRRDFDAVILDLGLPDSRREETLGKAKRIFGDCPIIIVSLYFDPDFIRKCIRESASGYFVKTMNDTAKELTECIDKAIRCNRIYLRERRAAMTV